MFFQGGSCGRAIGGQVYEWAIDKLASLDPDKLEQLRKHVHAEISRFCLYFTGEEIYSEQISFSNDAWLIQCSLNGRWASWNNLSRKKSDFNSHNIDFSSDQANLFAAIVAMNTKLRQL